MNVKYCFHITTIQEGKVETWYIEGCNSKSAISHRKSLCVNKDDSLQCQYVSIMYSAETNVCISLTIPRWAQCFVRAITNERTADKSYVSKTGLHVLIGVCGHIEDVYARANHKVDRASSCRPDCKGHCADIDKIRNTASSVVN